MQKIKSVFLVITFSYSLTAFSQSVKINVEKGQKYKVETTSSLSSSAEIMGQTMENNTDSKNITIYKITDTEKKQFSLQLTTTKIQVTAYMMGQTMSYDSDKNDNEGPMAEILSKLLNKVKTLTLDRKGNITKTDIVYDGSMNNSMGMPGSGQETITELFIPALIGKEIKAGDSFTDISDVKKEKYTSHDSGTYKIMAIENGLASISYSGTQLIIATMEQMGMEMQSTSNNIVKHELQMDIKTGMILAKASVVESILSIDAGGMTIPGTGKTITTVMISPEI
jgi:Family of unknown function (DUF6263)